MPTSLELTPSTATDLLSTEQLKSSWSKAKRPEFGDPTLARVKMSFRETFFPLGFPVVLSTNSPEVLEIAAGSWGAFSKEFDTEPLRIDIGVSLSEAAACPPTPVCRVRGHLSTNIADGENFAITDHSKGSSLIWVTTAAMRNRDYFRYFFLDASVLGGISSRYATGIHAACVALDGTGVLLCGDSGAGKTTLSYACARAGWTYITDDGSYLVHGREDRLVAGNCRQVRFRPSAESLFPELQGREAMERAGVGKPSIELGTLDHGSLKTANTAVIHHIVFLKRNVSREELAVFPSAVARLCMMQRVYCLPQLGVNHLGAVDHLLRVGALELRYDDLGWAIDRLSRLVREGC